MQTVFQRCFGGEPKAVGFGGQKLGQAVPEGLQQTRAHKCEFLLPREFSSNGRCKLIYATTYIIYFRVIGNHLHRCPCSGCVVVRMLELSKILQVMSPDANDCLSVLH